MAHRDITLWMPLQFLYEQTVSIQLAVNDFSLQLSQEALLSQEENLFWRGVPWGDFEYGGSKHHAPTENTALLVERFDPIHKRALPSPNLL